MTETDGYKQAAKEAMHMAVKMCMRNDDPQVSAADFTRITFNEYFEMYGGDE